MVAENSADFPIFRGHTRQRGRGFGTLAQTLGRTAIPFIKKCIVPAAKRIGAALFEIAAPEIEEVVSGSKKNSKNLQKMWEQKQFGNNWEVEKRNTTVELVKPDLFLKKIDRKTVALMLFQKCLSSVAQTFLIKNKMSVNQSHFWYGAFTYSSVEIFDEAPVLKRIIAHF